MSVYAPWIDELLCQRSSPLTIAGLLGSITVFTVPPFQRAYAWDSNAVGLFLGDVDRCRERRLLDTPQAHFFGAIVSTPEIMPGTPLPYAMLIDGQQRLATVFLYLSRLRHRFDVAADRADTAGWRTAFALRSDILRSSFEWIEDLEFLQPKRRCRLNLNRVDDPFFKQLLDGADAVPSSASHERMRNAVKKIDSYFDSLFERRISSEDDNRILTALYVSFLRDWEIVHISARTRRQANTLYRVLNSRGVPVSDCDLLRAATLERVDGPLDAPEVQGLSQTWDEIIGLDADGADRFLDFAFQSRTGDRRPTDRTASNFESSFFPILDSDEPLTAVEAKSLVRRVMILRDDSMMASGMRAGDLSRGPGRALSLVMSERLRALTHLFKQDYCIPLLLAASSLRPETFAELVNVLDRFAFRYGVLVRAPVGPFERCVKPYIRSLRSNPPTLNVGEIRRGLQAVLDRFASLSVFTQRLKALRYGTGQNAHIRYFLAMIEWTDVWYNSGAHGSVRVRDETRGIDLANVTIEHIGATGDQTAAQELLPLMNTLGNLTLLSQTENDGVANKQFTAKAPVYQRSSFAINRALVADNNREWGAAEVVARESDLLSRSEKIFTLSSS